MQSKLSTFKVEIIKKWKNRILESYGEKTAQFHKRENNRFANPVAFEISNSLPVILDKVLGDVNTTILTPALDSIIRIRSVQEFSEDSTLAFIPELKEIIERIITDEKISLTSKEKKSLLDKVDTLFVRGSEIYKKCREDLHRVREKELLRRNARSYRNRT